ncbi:O-antigen ligase family protein [Aquisalimonas sp. APHAB1-3]|uniref:O-antigen ligase family protein n=1 Tax=Aquisalimonas sp. APHAB1-3 TaxID=3402080 RepID=UPI003AABA123
MDASAVQAAGIARNQSVSDLTTPLMDNTHGKQGDDVTASANTTPCSTPEHHSLFLRVSGWLATAGCILLLLSVSVSKAGQNIGGGLLLLAFLTAGAQVWREALRHRIVWATLAWIAAITASMIYAATAVGVPLEEQTTHLWRFSRLFLIPLVAWGVAVSRLGPHNAYVILFAAFVLGTLYHMSAAGWPWFFTHSGRADISGENVQFYGLLSATALIAAMVFGSAVHRHVYTTARRVAHYTLWGVVALAAIQGLFISLARGAFLALAVAGTVWCGLTAWRTLYHSTLRWPHALATASITIGIATAIVYSGVVDHSIGRVQTDVEALMAGPDPETGFFQDRSMGIRLNQWQVGLSAFFDHSLLGHGTDGSRFVRDNAELPERSARAAPHHFHNIYIDVLIRFGILGALVIGWFTVEYLRAIRHANPDTSPPIAPFAMLALLLFLVAGLTQTYWTSQVTWFYLAAVFGPACAGTFTHPSQGGR